MLQNQISAFVATPLYTLLSSLTLMPFVRELLLLGRERENILGYKFHCLIFEYFSHSHTLAKRNANIYIQRLKYLSVCVYVYHTHTHSKDSNWICIESKRKMTLFCVRMAKRQSIFLVAKKDFPFSPRKSHRFVTNFFLKKFEDTLLWLCDIL